MIHNPGFLKVVNDAKTRVREISVEEVRIKQERHDDFVLVDVREDTEWAAGRAAGAVHIGKGVLERDIETIIKNQTTEIVLYCGGGFRSALAGDVLQQMGYRNVLSMAGGIKAWRDHGYPQES